ncbi:MAG: DUF58 domain-containing protein [Verrucomicrobiales bacterium]|nr:DUF58 domain-containing protein [Verrucomicrobiales bacterium]
MKPAATASWIVPRAPLLLAVGGIAVPAAFLVVADPEWLRWALGIQGAVMVLALVDLVLVWGKLDFIRLDVPPRIRGVRGRRTAVALTMQSGAVSAVQVRAALAWPPEVEPAEGEVRSVSLPSSDARVTVQFEGIPRRRGQFRLGSVRLGIVSPLGFWDYRSDRPIQSDLCAYPDLRRDQATLAALFLSRDNVGFRAQRQVGKGREFEKLREYVPGDGFDDIHWKATAKRGHPVTKVFQVERTQEVYVILDASRLSGRCLASTAGDRGTEAEAAHEEPVLESMISAALLLGQIAERQGDLFGLTVFADRVERFVRAGNGSAHYQVCRDALLRVSTREVSPDYDELGAFLRLRLRRRALLLYLTVLEDPLIAESFVKHAELVSRQHLLLVSMPRSPELRPLFSSPAVTHLDEVYEHLGGHLRWADWRAHAIRLERLGVRSNLVDPGRLAADLVENYLSVKRRQML